MRASTQNVNQNPKALTEKQFNLLRLLATSEKAYNQRQLQHELGYSLGIINKLVKDLTSQDLIKANEITKKGLKILEPYRAKRAIFVAAGFGSRLMPVTLTTPKPMVKVNGRRIIETLIDACIAADIKEIYIVRGYLAECFDELLKKYPMIKFIENTSYKEANNIGSVVAASNLLENAYILEADLLVSNPAIITKYHYTSDVLGIWKERTDDWVLNVDKNGYVHEEAIGGINTYQMVGIYYLNSADGAKLSQHIKEAYAAPGGKERYWETVPNQTYRGQYRIKMRPCLQEDIIEIDTIRELKAIDKSYDV